MLKQLAVETAEDYVRVDDRLFSRYLEMPSHKNPSVFIIQHQTRPEQYFAGPYTYDPQFATISTGQFLVYYDIEIANKIAQTLNRKQLTVAVVAIPRLDLKQYYERTSGLKKAIIQQKKIQAPRV